MKKFISRNIAVFQKRNFKCSKRIFQTEDDFDRIAEAGYYFEKAQIAISQNQINEAITNLRESLKYSKTSRVSKEAYWLLYTKYLETGDFARTLSVIEEACQYFPDVTEFLIGKSNTLLKMQKFNEAKAVAEQIYEKEPKTSTLNMTLGIIYLQTQNYLKAIEHFQKSLEYEQDFEPVLCRMYLAQSFRAIGDTANYQKYVKEAQNIDPNETGSILRRMQK